MIIFPIVAILLMNIYNLSYMRPQIFWTDTNRLFREMGETIAAEAEDGATIAMVYNTAEYGWNGIVQSQMYQYVNHCDLPWSMNIYSDDYQDTAVCEKAEKVLWEADYLYFLSTNDSMNRQSEIIKTV